MKVNLYVLTSSIPDQKRDEYNQDFISELNSYLFDDDIELVEGVSSPIDIVFVGSGGSENEFIKIKDKISSTFVLVSTDKHNSLPAALEIKTYCASQNLFPLIVNGDRQKIASLIKEISFVFQTKEELKGLRLGVIGRPSDWLISSLELNYEDVKRKFGIDLIDIDLEELYEEIDNIDIDSIRGYDEFFKKSNDHTSLLGALRIYDALKNIVNKYKLFGFTIRCFDMLKKYSNTACLALAIFNQCGIIATCEGDIPTLLTMTIVNKITSFSSFQANPSYINYEKKKVLFAHCTAPIDMLTNYEFDTHFESGLGVAIKGEFPLNRCSIVKIAPNLKDFICIQGKATSSPYELGYCRSQLFVELSDESLYTLVSENFANHIVITYSNIFPAFTVLLEHLNHEEELRNNKK